MLIGITDGDEILRLIKKLNSLLNKYKTFTGQRTILYPQGKEVRKIHYSKELGIWWHFGNTGHNKYYWNCYGLENPDEKQSLRIAVEIIMPYTGKNLRIAGMWAKDNTGNVFLLHDGGIGGGGVGIGKRLFSEKFNGSYQQVSIDGALKKYALVLSLLDTNMPYQLEWFIRKIREIKDLAKQEKDNLKKTGRDFEKKHKYNPEFSGTKRYNLPDEIKVDCNHGIVVDELYKRLTAKGYICSNADYIDLYTIDANNIYKNMFEVKSNLSRQAIYTAIGQLQLNSRPMNPKPRYYFVCPNKIDRELIKDLGTLNIKVLTYVWEMRQPYFPELDNIF